MCRVESYGTDYKFVSFLIHSTRGMVGGRQGHIKRSVQWPFSKDLGKGMLMIGVRYVDWHGFRTWGYRSLCPIEEYLELHAGRLLSKQYHLRHHRKRSI